jgi:hypothetical protein
LETRSAAGRGILKTAFADFVNSATDRAQDLTSDGTTAVRNAATSTTSAALEAAKGLRDKAADASHWAGGKTVFETIEQNPLLVAGVGLLIGGLIASALPRTGIEESLVGDASASAKRRAQEAASHGVDAAKGAAGEILENVARRRQALRA